MKKIHRRAVCLIVFAVLACIGGAALAAAPDVEYAPFAPTFVDITDAEPMFFNTCYVDASADAGKWPRDYVWAAQADGGSCLMIRITVGGGKFADNANILSTEFQSPYAEMDGKTLLLAWDEMYEPGVGVVLAFQDGSDVMTVKRNTISGKRGEVKLATQVYRDDRNKDWFYLPLYAILNEIGGSVTRGLEDIEGTFISSGTQEAPYDFTGQWENSDRALDNQRIVLDGKEDYVGYPWRSLELLEGGLFTECRRDFVDGEWIYTIYEGFSGFAGKNLVLKYMLETRLQGPDYANLAPVMHDERYAGLPELGGVEVHYVSIGDDDELFVMEWPDSMYASHVLNDGPSPRPPIPDGIDGGC